MPFKDTAKGNTYFSFFEEDFPRVAVVGSYCEFPFAIESLVTNLNGIPTPLEANFYAPTSNGLRSSEQLETEYDRLAGGAVAVILVVGHGLPHPEIDVGDGIPEVELQFMEFFRVRAQELGVPVLSCVWTGRHEYDAGDERTPPAGLQGFRDTLRGDLWSFDFQEFHTLFDLVKPVLDLCLDQARYVHDVAVSYTSADSDVAEGIARDLKQRDIRVFFAEDPESSLVGKHLSEKLRRIYEAESRYCLVIASQSYLESPHSMLEWESALRRNAKENADYLVVVKLDDVSLPGLAEDVVYLDRDRIEQIGEIMTGKIRGRS